MVRRLAQMLAVNRIAFGIGYVVLPAKTGRGWIGDAAEDPRTRVFTRALGARDVALGTGALAAFAGGRDRNGAGWMAGHALADGTDLLATLAARRELPVRNLLFAMGMAGVSTAIAIAAALRLQDAEREQIEKAEDRDQAEG
jgi:hypothetical protein